MNQRDLEISFIKKGKFMDALCVYFWSTTTIIVTTFTFEIYLLMGYALNSENIFTTIALYNILVFPLNALPWTIGGIKTGMISIDRVKDFINQENILFKSIS